MRGREKTGLFIAAAAIVSATACGNRHTPTDDSLARDLAAVGSASSDLQLAPRGGGSQTVVSAIEVGSTSATTRATRKPAVKPVSHPAPLRAAPQRSAPPVTVVQSAPPPARPAAAPQEKAAEPPPLPPFPDAQGAGKARQRGTYGTEAEIFQRMPWIRP